MSCVRIKALLLALIILAFPLKAEAKEEEKRIVLTFDDGPHYKYTEQILDILEKYSVKAVFFTIGENASRFPELIERELDSGHEVANHTYSHKHMKDLTRAELTEEITGWEEVMSEHRDELSCFFRPPEGIVTDEEKELIESLGYELTLWSIDTRDWSHPSVDSIVNNVMTNAKDGAVILFHDFISGQSPTPAALEIIIPKLKAQGYRFVTLSEL